MGVYKDMIRQHMDLEAIQTRLEQGSYSPSNLLFFRDLLLLFNNALVFFPKHSVESLTAHKIRSLVMDEMRKDTQKSDSTVEPENIPSQPKREPERSDSLLAKHKSTIPIIVCRKRSSISAKPSSSSLGPKIEQQQQQQSNENKPVNGLKPPAVEQGLLKMKSEEKPVTGARSTRRGNKNLAKGSTSPSKKQNTSPDTKVAAPEKSETPKTEKKKNEALPLEKKKSAVDFLKRIKKNSPAETPKNNNRGASSGGERKMEGSGGKGERGKERLLKNSDKKQGKQESSPSKKNVGRPSKKAAEESRVSGKRGRDSGGKEVAKRPRKRSRR